MVERRHLGLVSLALAGCGVADAPGDVAQPIDDARSVVVTDCGSFHLEQGEGLPDSALRCFIDGVAAGHPVQLEETRLTVEGDPIPVTYRADVHGRVEVIIDSRRDNFGNQIISRQTCTGPVRVQGRLSFARCSEPTPIHDQRALGSVPSRRSSRPSP
jgi:hypothetical protein